MDNQTKITNKDDLFQPHIQKARNFILGDASPNVFTQIVFYFGSVLTFIFLLWNSVSLFIISFPEFLQIHKEVDAIAIIELRGRSLGFTSGYFHTKLLWFYSISSICWLLIGLLFIFLWRQKIWATISIFILIICYLVNLFTMLGIKYYLEDTTTFDKASIFVLLALIVILFVLQQKKRRENQYQTPVSQ